MFIEIVSNVQLLRSGAKYLVFRSAPKTHGRAAFPYKHFAVTRLFSLEDSLSRV
jgi:hypothetical protein